MSYLWIRSTPLKSSRRCVVWCVVCDLWCVLCDVCRVTCGVHRTAPHHTTPHHTTPHHTTPHHTTPHYTTPHHTTPHHTTPHHTTPHHTAPHHTTPHRTTPHHTTPHRRRKLRLAGRPRGERTAGHDPDGSFYSRLSQSLHHHPLDLHRRSQGRGAPGGLRWRGARVDGEPTLNANVGRC